MRTFVLLAAAALISGAAVASAQSNTPDTNPYDGSSATFGNKRPLIGKRQKAPTSKTVSGMVTDDSGKPLGGALVTLTNRKTKEHQEFFTKPDGRYRFEGLNFDADYQVQANFKGRESRVKPISQYDRAPYPVRMLDIPSAAAASKTTPTASAEAKK